MKLFKSDWYVYPAIPPDPIQALLINLPNAYTLWAPALNEARKAQTALNKAAAALKTTPNALLSSLHAESYPLNAKNLGLADYNPPQYTAINSSAQDASPKVAEKSKYFYFAVVFVIIIIVVNFLSNTD